MTQPTPAWKHFVLNLNIKKIDASFVPNATSRMYDVGNPTPPVVQTFSTTLRVVVSEPTTTTTVVVVLKKVS